MRSSLKNPHIYSSRAEVVSPGDWNVYMALNTPVIIDHTDSPYNLTNDVGVLIVLTDGGAVTVNVSENQHSQKIKNWGSLGNDVTLSSDLDIEDSTIVNGQCLEIISVTGLGIVTLTKG